MCNTMLCRVYDTDVICLHMFMYIMRVYIYIYTDTEVMKRSLAQLPLWSSERKWCRQRLKQANKDGGITVQSLGSVSMGLRSLELG